jgi:hypothetical protein
MREMSGQINEGLWIEKRMRIKLRGEGKKNESENEKNPGKKSS